MQHDWKHVERPGGSHTALDGKKKETSTRSLVNLIGTTEIKLWMVLRLHRDLRGIAYVAGSSAKPRIPDLSDCLPHR